jgi:Protein of unknown function (DUF499)
LNPCFRIIRVARGFTAPTGLLCCHPPRRSAGSYPTAGLKNLLRNVLARLTGDSSAAACIFRLDTSYGGGKTHGLIALTHAANGMNGVANIAEFIDPKFVPTSKIRIAAFDGENADPANGRSMDDGILAHTPWGEPACSLAGKAGYERVRKSDESHTAPGAETLAELFGGEPCIILLDELSVYLRKARNLHGNAAGDHRCAQFRRICDCVECSQTVRSKRGIVPSTAGNDPCGRVTWATPRHADLAPITKIPFPGFVGA